MNSPFPFTARANFPSSPAHALSLSCPSLSTPSLVSLSTPFPISLPLSLSLSLSLSSPSLSTPSPVSLSIPSPISRPLPVLSVTLSFSLHRPQPITGSCPSRRPFTAGEGRQPSTPGSAASPGQPQLETGEKFSPNQTLLPRRAFSSPATMAAVSGSDSLSSTPVSYSNNNDP